MLELKNICKDYYVDKKPINALKDINLFFPISEFCAILGPSGCGKTTLLNIIGGLDRYTSGDLIIEGISTKTYTDRERDNYRNKKIGFVFQSYNLIPHLSILSNVELAMNLKGVSKKDRIKQAKEALNKVGLSGIYNKKPNQLSGGQMQRVAIARALVNDPDVILADEPTGALDSKTSIQVMEILKEISKEKLVIMVTHNEKLAYSYADRVIIFKDGEIESDSKDGEKDVQEKENQIYYKMTELEVIDEKEKFKIQKKYKKDKSRISLLSTIKLSITSMFQKKGRTILTSIAASFGIIGIALVLALSNGFSNYVSRIEEETASSLPINVPSYTITNTKITSINYNSTDRFTDKEEIYPYIPNQTTASYEYKYNIFSNKYFAYLEYLKNNLGLINDYIVNYNYNYEYHLLTEFPESIDKETPSNIRQVNTSYRSSYSLSSIINSTTGVPYNAFHTLYGEEKYIRQNYDLIEGKYPTKSEELVLVVDQYNRISFETLRALGFFSSQDSISDIISEIEKSDDDKKQVKGFSFNDVLNKTYKIYSNDEFYEIRPIYSEDTFKGNVYLQKNLRTIYEDESLGRELKIVGILRPTRSSTISLMAEGLCFLPSLQEEIVKTNNNSYLATHILDNITLKSGMTFDEFSRKLISIIQSGDVSTNSIYSLFNTYFDTLNYIPSNSDYAYYTTISSFISNCRYFGLDLIPLELKEKPLSNNEESISYFIYYVLSNIVFNNDVNNQKKALLGLLAYLNNYSDIANVVIFPTDLSNKEILLNYLNEYNDITLADGIDDPYHAINSSEQVFFSDIVGTVTDTLAQVINVITIVLVILASVSLIVSCVMTGLITYAGVIERTREIGILRAIGARKKDVGRIFQSESAMIGLMAGVIGCLVAFIICFPINFIVNSIYYSYNIGSIASLNWIIVLVLIAISMLLTFVSGLIPARVAAKKDPVEALRSE